MLLFEFDIARKAELNPDFIHLTKAGNKATRVEMQRAFDFMGNI